MSSETNRSKHYDLAYEQGFRTLAEIPQADWPTAGDDVEFYDHGTLHLLEAALTRDAAGTVLDLIGFKGQDSDGVVYQDAIRSHDLIKVKRLRAI